MGRFQCRVTYLLLLSVYIHLASAASHSLQYLYTAVTPGTRSPEFTVVGLVDGEQFEYYDSNIRKLIPRNKWIRKIDADDPEFWKRETHISQANQEIFKDNMGTLIKRLNQTEGVHTWQLMYGCEMDDDGAVRGNRQYSYDGEDYISLDLNTVTYTAAHQKAVLTKHKWDSTRQAKFQTAYLLNECISWLKKYVGYGRSTLERRVRPELELLQKDSSSPVVCHATGFYPKAVTISWKKNGEDLDEDAELRETLPNQDDTFQRRSILTVPPEELDKHNYTCVIQHISLEKEMVLQVSDRRVLSGGWSVGLVHTVPVVVLLIVIVSVGVYFWKKKQSGFKPVSGHVPEPSERDTSSNSS